MAQPPGPNTLPDRCDVLVIGGGLAGLGCALFLAEGDVEVALADARPALFDGASGRSAGLVSAGMLDEPGRLIAALGLDDARAIYRFSLENRALLAERAPARGEGGLHAALGAAEGQAIPGSVEALRALDVPAALWSAEQVAEYLGATGFGPGRWVPGDTCVDPAAVGAALVDQARAAGAILAARSPVSEILDVDDGWLVRIGDREVLATALIYAGGAGLPALEPWFFGRILPVRGQCFVTAPVAKRFSGPLRSQQGYLYAAQAASGAMLFGGARWATPHLEVGETDDTVTVDAIEQKLLAFAHARFPDLAEVPIAARWSGISAFTCDGLPFVGPLPGDSSRLACAGFNGRGWGLALRAARAIADGLLTGRAEGLPDRFRPTRMV